MLHYVYISRQCHVRHYTIRQHHIFKSECEQKIIYEVKMKLESPKELAVRINVPVSNIRYLIKAGDLDHIFIAPGKRNPKIPDGAWERCLEKLANAEHA